MGFIELVVPCQQLWARAKRESASTHSPACFASALRAGRTQRLPNMPDFTHFSAPHNPVRACEDTAAMGASSSQQPATASRTYCPCVFLPPNSCCRNSMH